MLELWIFQKAMWIGCKREFYRKPVKIKRKKPYFSPNYL